MARPSPAIQQCQVALSNVLEWLYQEAQARPPRHEALLAASAAEEALAALDRMGGANPATRPAFRESMEELWLDVEAGN